MFTKLKTWLFSLYGLNNSLIRVSAGCSDVVREVIEPLEKINAPLETSWGIIKNLFMTNTRLMPATTYIPLHHRARRARSSKYYSKAIYNACKVSKSRV